MNVLDSSAWIEFFLGSNAGETYRPVVAEMGSLIVPTVAILEVHRFLSRTGPSTVRDEHLDVMRRAQVVDLTDGRAIAASEVAQKHKLAMADAVKYSIAREFKATFWTQDVDYKGLQGVNYQARKPAPKLTRLR